MSEENNPTSSFNRVATALGGPGQIATQAQPAPQAPAAIPPATQPLALSSLPRPNSPEQIMEQIEPTQILSDADLEAANQDSDNDDDLDRKGSALPRGLHSAPSMGPGGMNSGK